MADESDRYLLSKFTGRLHTHNIGTKRKLNAWALYINSQLTKAEMPFQQWVPSLDMAANKEHKNTT